MLENPLLLTIVLGKQSLERVNAHEPKCTSIPPSIQDGGKTVSINVTQSRIKMARCIKQCNAMMNVNIFLYCHLVLDVDHLLRIFQRCNVVYLQ